MTEPGINWTGNLDDDCTAMWSGLRLRAEWMDGDRWWWSVCDADSGLELDSSDSPKYAETAFMSGHAARKAAERVARSLRIA